MGISVVRSVACRVPRWLWVILVGGILPRLLITPGTVPVLWPDSLTYLKSATAMVEDGNYWMHEVYRTPMYPLYLSFFLRTFGFEPLAGEMIVAGQRVMGVLSGVLLFLVLRRGFSERVALASSVIFLWSSLQLFYETSILTETQFIFLLFLFFWISGRVFDEASLGKLAWWSSPLLGGFAALLSLSRPIGQLLLLLYLAFLLVRFRFRRDLLVAAVTALGCFVVVVFPWAKVNHDRYGFWGISRDFGINLFHRVLDVDNTPLPPESSDTFIRDVYTRHNVGERITYFYVYFALRRDEGAKGTPKRLVQLRVDQRMANFAMEVLKANPQYFLPQTLRNFWDLFVSPRVSLHFCSEDVSPPVLCSNHPGIFSPGFDVHAEHTTTWSRAAAEWVVGALRLPDGVWALLCVIGAAFGLRGPRWEHRSIFLVTILYFTGLAALFNCAEDRFRLPVEGFIVSFAVFACYQVVSKARTSLGRQK